MYRVTEEVFKNYLDGRDLMVIPGEIFHSMYYMEGDIKRGYKETSSWGAKPIYMIDRDDIGVIPENIETLYLISNFL